MKNKIIFFLVVTLLTSSLLVAQGKVFFDVKTKWAEKSKMTHIKTMFSYKLLNSDWANVTEVGEEYQIWLKNYRKVQDDNVFTTTIDLEIRRPKLLGEGELVEKREVKVVFVTGIDNRRVDTHFELAEKILGHISEELKMEATEVSERLYRELESMRYLFDRY